MLRTLHIENVAVIETADVDFGGGLHVLTGETGAGKSIVIDAISAILGERTPREVIRTGAAKAFVSAVFDGVPELAWFAENGVDYDPEALLVQREIFPDGKNSCRVNGRPVTVTLLRRLGLQLINIHGQHDSQRLFDEANHLIYLDAFAHDEALLEAYGAAFSKAQALRREIDRLDMDEAEKARLVARSSVRSCVRVRTRNWRRGGSCCKMPKSSRTRWKPRQRRSTATRTATARRRCWRRRKRRSRA